MQLHVHSAINKFDLSKFCYAMVTISIRKSTNSALLFSSDPPGPFLLLIAN